MLYSCTVVVSCITCVSPRYFVEMSHKLPMKCEYECLLVFLLRFPWCET